ncbi:MAG TPA: hypothetical protein VEQ63_13110 [Bryobacteraceae bacterium]|nr:hypothetical protein [Bryobacteraceae bacterium]
MRPIVQSLILASCALGLFGQSELTDIKKLEVDRLQAMAQSGAIPRARLEQAQAELADAEDNAILRRTLYGQLGLEDFTKEQSDVMVAAAQRLVDRHQERMKQTEKLVSEGVVARGLLVALQEDMAFREKALDLAKFRAKLVEELAEQVNAEGELADSGALPLRNRRVIERYDGIGVFRETDFIRISTAFERQFARPLPISAKGETAIHKSMGYDHRGRVDVALNPDQREGVWLRNFLQKARIPYYAFRAAVKGKATAPHIHMGPPSPRYRTAD